MQILNPKNVDYSYLDEKSRNLMLKTIEFFENKGLANVKKDDHDRAWYGDFLEFVKKEQAFSILISLTYKV